MWSDEIIFVAIISITRYSSDNFLPGVVGGDPSFVTVMIPIELSTSTYNIHSCKTSRNRKQKRAAGATLPYTTHSFILCRKPKIGMPFFDETFRNAWISVHIGRRQQDSKTETTPTLYLGSRISLDAFRLYNCSSAEFWESVACHRYFTPQYTETDVFKLSKLSCRYLVKA